MLLSFVLPAFNEEHRIGPTLEQTIRYRRDCPHDIEVIVVDDGSDYAVSAVAEAYLDELPELRVIRHETNRGKGRAVATGMTAATGDYRAFFDADGATPIAEVDRLLEVALATPRTVPIGSVRAKGAIVGKRQPISRALAGRAGNLFMQAMVLPGVADSQRGCKLFPGPLADVVFAAQQLDGWGFDIEVLALCQRLGYQVVEVPVTWNHIEGGQIRPSAYLSTLAEVMRVRRLLRTDAHHLPVVPQAARAGHSPT